MATLNSLPGALDPAEGRLPGLPLFHSCPVVGRGPKSESGAPAKTKSPAPNWLVVRSAANVPRKVAPSLGSVMLMPQVATTSARLKNGRTPDKC